MPNKVKLPAPKTIADRAIAVLEDHKAIDVRCIDVRHLTSLMDYMIVATGRSDRHVRSLAGALIGYALGIASYVAGLALSVVTDLPSSAVIVWTMAVLGLFVHLAARGTPQAPSAG